jgi:predicted nucleic acid-binding protein
VAKAKLILCDTNIIIEAFRGNPEILTELDLIGYPNLYISDITIAEIYFGMKRKEARKTRELLNKFSQISIDQNISSKMLSLLYQFRDRAGIPDSIITATALLGGFSLYTLNKIDFDFVKGLKFYNPKTARKK